MPIPRWCPSSRPRGAVHARAEPPPGVRRLRLAGVEQLISIHPLGGQRIANAIVRPAVVDFIELASPGGGAPIDLEEVLISEGCRIDPLPLRDLPAGGVRIAVVAIKREGQHLGQERRARRSGPAFVQR